MPARSAAAVSSPPEADTEKTVSLQAGASCADHHTRKSIGHVGKFRNDGQNAAHRKGLRPGMRDDPDHLEHPSLATDPGSSASSAPMNDEARMFSVSQDEATAIQNAFHERGEWAAVAELRRYFPIQDNADALNAVRAIARWTQRPHAPSSANP